MFLEVSHPQLLQAKPLAAWKANEKPPEEVEALFTSAAEASGSDNGGRFRQVMQDLTHLYLSGELHIGKCLALLKIVDFRAMPHLAEGVADLFWLVGSQLAAQPASDAAGSKWRLLCELIKGIASQGIINPTIFKLALAPELLHGSGLFGVDAERLNKRLIKINTSMMFTQQKYNLLREETEGYSKLVAVLVNLPTHNAARHVENIVSLIGFFDLDPNRVLDIVLDIYEQNLWNPSFLEVLKTFRGNSLSHLLGFKFQYYTTQAASEAGASPKAPASLFRMAILLIGIGVVSLDALGPYLSPTLDAMEKTESEYQAKLKSEIRSFGVISLSGPSKDDKAKDETKEQAQDERLDEEPSAMFFPPPEGPWSEGNQWLGLLAAALELKLWTIAQPLFELLTERGCDCCRDSTVRNALIGLIRSCTDQAYEVCKPRLQLGVGNTAATSTTPTSNAQGQQDSDLLPTLPAELRAVDSVDVMEVPTTLEPVLKHLGHHIQVDMALYFRVCRMLAVCMQRAIEQQLESEYLERCQDLVMECLLPGLSCSATNPAAVSALWQVLEKLPYNVRYEMYQSWRRSSEVGKGASRNGAVALQEAKALYDAKQLLKRLSVQNTRHIGRQLAKRLHCNPIVILSYILSSIEAYDNLIQPIVDALRYATPLALDVMGWSIMNQLAGDRDKLKPDGTHYAQWVNSVAKFTGAFFRKYPQTEILGVIHYIMKELAEGQPLDVLVLKELLAKMGGAETTFELSSGQLESMAGSWTLRATAVNLTEKDNASKRAVKQLRSSLLGSGLALRLLVLLSKIGNSVLYAFETRHVKLLTNVVDMCQLVLMQYMEFIMTPPASLKVKDKQLSYESETTAALLEVLPSFQELHNDMRLDLPVVFTLCRPLLRAALVEHNDPAQVGGVLAQWHPLSDGILQTIKGTLPQEAWRYISPELYVLFWTLSSYDLFSPNAQYQSEISRLRSVQNRLETTMNTTPGADHKEARKELAATTAALQRLRVEVKEQDAHVARIREVLLIHRENYLPHVAEEHLMFTTDTLMQYCILPRVRMSPTDAWFVPRFIFQMHALDTPRLSTLHLLNRMVHSLPALAFCSTEYDAASLGYVLRGVFEVANAWTDNKAQFLAEGKSKCGMSTRFDVTDADNRVEHDQFMLVYRKWHDRLTKTLLNCFASDEYMHIRSGLVMLHKMIDVFPHRKKGCQVLKLKIKGLETDPRDDIKLTAKSVFNMLNARYDKMVKDDEDGKPSLKPAAPIEDAATNGKVAEEAEVADNKKETASSKEVKKEAPQKAAAQKAAPQKAAQDKTAPRGTNLRAQLRDKIEAERSGDSQKDQPKERHKDSAPAADAGPVAEATKRDRDARSDQDRESVKSESVASSKRESSSVRDRRHRRSRSKSPDRRGGSRNDRSDSRTKRSRDSKADDAEPLDKGEKKSREADREEKEGASGAHKRSRESEGEAQAEAVESDKDKAVKRGRRGEPHGRGRGGSRGGADSGAATSKQESQPQPQPLPPPPPSRGGGRSSGQGRRRDDDRSRPATNSLSSGGGRRDDRGSGSDNRKQDSRSRRNQRR